MYMGIDIGSSSSKAVIVNKNHQVLARAVINTGTGTRGPEKVVEMVLESAKLSPEDILFRVVTGYGRMMYDKADRQITEISCHARGVAHLVPEARTVIDIGGQDAKIIRLDTSGRVENFVMNDKCAAGTGRFIEVMARILDCPIEHLAELSRRATEEIAISSTCTVFAESEVISQLASGAKRENVAKGAHHSVAMRVAGLGGRIGIKPIVVMTGGVALNSEIVAALAAEIGYSIVVAENPQTIGALGAALYASDSLVQ
jgi:predicted CoA-substrate-specific enzyme activase